MFYIFLTEIFQYSHKLMQVFYKHIQLKTPKPNWPIMFKHAPDDFYPSIEYGSCLSPLIKIVTNHCDNLDDGSVGIFPPFFD